MGGNAFASGPNPLTTPRMPKDVYLLVKERCYTILREMYEVVDSPIEGPGKEDFGDIDILLFGPKPGLPQDSEAELRHVAKALGAVKVIYIPESSSNLAIPWPSDVEHSVVQTATESEAEGNSASQVTSSPPHIQVDVRICDQSSKLQWQLFKHAHGDIWNILGSTIRPFGLTADETALWLRVPEIEHSNRKRAKVFLTSDHEEVLGFLGLSSPQYWKGPFENVDSMYEYAAQCRMFSVPPLDQNDADGMSGEEKVSSQGPLQRKLKTNDRRRMNYRPAFRKWVEEFVPQCREQGRFLELNLTRDEVTQQAMDKFSVKDEFEQRLQEFLLERDRDSIWKNVIKLQVPEADLSSPRSITYRGCLLKALKKAILESDCTYVVVPEQGFRDDKGFFIPEAVQQFIYKNKDEIGRKAYDLHHEAYLTKKEKDSTGATF